MERDADVIIIKNNISEDGMHQVHLMDNAEFDAETYEYYFARGAWVEREDGAWNLYVEYPYRGVLDVELGGKPKIRRFVVWPVEQSAEAAVQEAAREYNRLFGRPPMFAWTRELPGGVENGAQVGIVVSTSNAGQDCPADKGECHSPQRYVNLFEAIWALRGSVMVGGDALFDEEGR
jgi:hypothetical protein